MFAPSFTSHIENQKFHAIFKFDPVVDDFIIAGIFSLKSDAELMKLDLTLKGHERVARIEMSLVALKEFLLAEKIGRHTPQIKKLEAIYKGLIEVEDDNRTTAKTISDRRGEDMVEDTTP